VWRTVTSRIRELGITRMVIFLRGRRLFMYLEAPPGFDPAVDFARLNDDPRYVEWDRLMRGFQEPAPEAAPGDWWTAMERVFDLDWFPATT
jgi:L-rhamnose mutarotase